MLRSACLALLSAAFAVGCAAPPPAAPEPAAAPTASDAEPSVRPTAGAQTPRPVAGPMPDDPLAAVVPVQRLVAGEADTLVVEDLVGSTAPVAFLVEADAAVTARALADGRMVLRARPDADGLYTVPFEVAGAVGALAVEVAQQPEVTFRFEPDLTTADAAPPAVFVIGGFNDWSRSATPLRPLADGALGVDVRIAPGRYEYKLTVDGAEVLDPTSRDSVANPFGAYNNVLTVAPVTEGALNLRLVGPDAEDPSLLRFSLRAVDADGRESTPEDLDDATAIVALDGNRLLDENAVYLDPPTGRLAIDLDELAPGLRRLRVAARGTEPGDGRRSGWVEVPVWNRRPLASADGPDAAPPTWHDAVIYQIVVDRFFDGDARNTAPLATPGLDRRADYQGGDLAGIRQKLREGYFDRLGVTALWLSPLYPGPDHAEREFPAPNRLYSGYHGYWPVEPRAVEPRFGTMAELKALVAEAHDRGIAVLLDFVANHVHEDHPYAREHPDWFGTLELPNGELNLRRWDDYRLTTWFEPYLPSFDFAGAPDAVEQLTADAAWWLRETGADGFRHDAVKHVPNAFWRALTRRLRDAVPRDAGQLPLYQIGETFGSNALVGSYITPGQLDAQFNFGLYDAAIAALARGGPLSALADALDASQRAFGPLHLMGNPVDSHDKTRFLALVENDVSPGQDDREPGWSDAPPRVDDPASYERLELALAYTLTTPGVPVVYYGDEVGMTGANDPDNRRFMVWDGLSPEQLAHRDAVARLIRLRRDTPALRTGTVETLYADDTAWLFRRTAPGSDVLVALNTGDADRRLTASEAPVLGTLGPGDLPDLLDPARPLRDGGPTTVRVPAGGYRVLRVR